MNITARLRSYLQLTKPTIMLLVLFTGATALVVEGSLLSQPLQFGLVLLGLYLTGGSANAFNQYFEREIDARMSRTARRRPLPLHQVSPTEAFWFAVVIGAVGVTLFAVAFNWLTAVLSLATLLFYALFYTLWLKPNTWQNIVIGGAAGAMAPVGAWTAATGSMAVAPWLMFALVFLWTPPHFWALAMICKDDYVKARLPMLPVVKGETETIRQILWYSIALVAASLTLTFFSAHWLYFVAAVGLGGWLMKKALVARQVRTMTAYRALFGCSIVYLFALFAAIIVDSLLLT